MVSEYLKKYFNNRNLCHRSHTARLRYLSEKQPGENIDDGTKPET
jgi:hypothetical protein